MLRPTPKGVTFKGNERFEGFTIDLLQRVSKDLQFKYNIIVSPGNLYGQLDKNGDWNGMVGAIKAKVSELFFRYLQVVDTFMKIFVCCFSRKCLVSIAFLLISQQIFTFKVQV